MVEKTFPLIPTMNTPSQYDQFAKDFHCTRQKSWPEFEIIMPYMQKNDRVLDLGCGNARFRNALDLQLIPEGNYFGLDISEELLKFARAEYPRDHFFRGNFASTLPFGADNFDMVVSIAAFHHLLNPKDQCSYIAECYRVLKPGGIIFLTAWKLPDKYFWQNILMGRFKNWIIPFGPEKHPRTYRRTSARELKKLLKKVGFEVLRGELFRGRNFVVLGRKKMKINL